MIAGRRDPLLLLIEDHRDTLVATGRLLEASGFAVEVAKGGEQGIAKAKQLRPDVVVTDVMMPGTSGCEVCEELHGYAATRDIPIIIYTGLTDARALGSVVAYGVRVFAIKPCLPTVIAREAHALLAAAPASTGLRVLTGHGEPLEDFAREVQAYAVEPAT